MFVGVVSAGITPRSENITKMTIEALDVRIATQDEIILSKIKRLKQGVIVENLRALKIRQRNLNTINSNNFAHGVMIKMRGLALGFSRRRRRLAGMFGYEQCPPHLSNLSLSSSVAHP